MKQYKLRPWGLERCPHFDRVAGSSWCKNECKFNSCYNENDDQHGHTDFVEFTCTKSFTIADLLEEQKQKIVSLKHLIDIDRNWYNRDLDKHGLERLKVRIKMREEFIEKLESLDEYNAEKGEVNLS